MQTSSSRVDFQRERFHDLSGDIAPLAIEHFNETSPFVTIGLQPDIERYCAMEDGDMLRCYTAREDGALVGYASFIVCANPHYRHSMQAHHDVTYVLPEYRQRALGVQLLDFAFRALAENGTDVVYQATSEKCDIGPLLAGMGFILINHVWAKDLRARASHG